MKYHRFRKASYGGPSGTDIIARSHLGVRSRESSLARRTVASMPILERR